MAVKVQALNIARKYLILSMLQLFLKSVICNKKIARVIEFAAVIGRSLVRSQDSRGGMHNEEAPLLNART